MENLERVRCIYACNVLTSKLADLPGKSSWVFYVKAKVLNRRRGVLREEMVEVVEKT